MQLDYTKQQTCSVTSTIINGSNENGTCIHSTVQMKNMTHATCHGPNEKYKMFGQRKSTAYHNINTRLIGECSKHVCGLHRVEETCGSKAWSPVFREIRSL